VGKLQTVHDGACIEFSIFEINTLMAMQLSDLDFNNIYTYADYYSWTFDERVELINGKLFNLYSPGTEHQRLSGRISVSFYNYLKDKPFEVFAAPFDIRFPADSKNDEDIFTVVQPDISVICDRSKIDERGCIGAPDIVVEILVAGNNRKELKEKYDLYENAGVKEYWIIHSVSKTFLKYTLHAGHFAASRLLTFGDIVTTPLLPNYVLNLDILFAERN
jgi:Uma2 family endonuclease